MLAGLFSKKEKESINWSELSSLSDLDAMDAISNSKPIIVFKHSTRCMISSVILNKLERNHRAENELSFYFLDLIANRTISNEVEARYGIVHQSPQAIIISKGKAIYDTSHSGVVYQDLLSRVKEVGI